VGNGVEKEEDELRILNGGDGEARAA